MVEVIGSSGRHAVPWWSAGYGGGHLTVRELISKLRQEPRWDELLKDERGMKQLLATVSKVAEKQGAGQKKRLVLRKITMLHERLLKAVEEEEKEARKVWLKVDRVFGGPSGYRARLQARS